MKDNKVSYKLIGHIHQNLILYLITVLFLCIGIVIGMYSVKYMSDVEKSNLISYLRNLCETISQEQVNRKYIFIEAIKNNIAIIVAVWFLGLTILGIPIILIIDLFKGFTIGFTSSLVINGLGTKGILIDLLIIFPQNIIYIPCIVISSVIAIEFSLILLKSISIKSINKNGNLIQIAAYSTVFIFITGFMFVGFILEGYISPSILKFIAYSGGNVIL